MTTMDHVLFDEALQRSRDRRSSRSLVLAAVSKLAVFASTAAHRPATVKMMLAMLAITLVLIGCVSPPHSGIDDTTISVTVRPLDQVHYELTAVIQRRQQNHPRNSYGEDRYSFPPIIAAVSGEPVESFNGNVPGLGPKARLKILREAGKIIAEYRVGYTDVDQSYYTEGRMEVAPR